MECAVRDCPHPGAVEAFVRLSHRPAGGGRQPREFWEVHEILAHLCQGHALDEPFDPRHLRLGAPFLSYRGTPTQRGSDG
jgi:hypothetical protein